MLTENSIFPNFKLLDKDDKEYSLDDFKGKYKVVYFYPKDNTPGCTIEAKEFTELLPTFEKSKINVIGISGGDSKTKEKFCDKQELKLLLLSDTDFSFTTKIGIYGEKKFMGRTYIGINRVTFILDSDNKILKIYPKVKVKGHAQDALDFISNL